MTAQSGEIGCAEATKEMMIELRRDAAEVKEKLSESEGPNENENQNENKNENKNENTKIVVGT